MSHSGRTEITTETLTAYLEGDVTPTEASRIEAELRESPMLKRRLMSLRNIRDALSQSMPEHRDLDLVPALRQALAAPAAAATKRRAAAWMGAQWWAAAAAGGILIIGGSWIYRSQSNKFAQNVTSQSTAAEPELEEFRVKSGGLDIVTPSRWAGVRVYRVAPAGKPERLTGTLSTEDGLLFSYTNLGSSPFDYLVIFSVDAHKNVRWFYPAYEQPGTNPPSISIKHDLADVPLPDLINQDWAPGPIAIHALFSSRPLHVLEVEAWIEHAGSVQAIREPLKVSGAFDQVTTTELAP